jgi:FKBP-type peptidyl-prolyl cis-trans isomerase FklB
MAKNFPTFPLLGLLLFMYCHLGGQNQSTIKMDSLSYSLGVIVGQNIKSQGIDGIDTTSLANGLADMLSGAALKIDMQEANAILNDYFKMKQMAQFESIIEEGRLFLAENGQRAEVVTLESGLQYEILSAGTGARPLVSDRVTVHYHGSLLSGQVFDSSVERGSPATFGVGQLIAGWTEALQLMPEGSKWRLYIPYDLAYGDRGAGQDIPPYATLVFDIELIKIVK